MTGSETSPNIDEDRTLESRMKDFKKVVVDLMKDLLTTFPELENDLDRNLRAIISDEDEEYFANDKSLKEIYEHCKSVYPEKFFDILYQNPDVFTAENSSTEFLPGIDFGKLWKENISDATRETIWKYLQLILFTVVSTISEKDSFGDTAKLFEAIDETEFRSKLEETISKMQDVFDMSGSSSPDLSGAGNFPNPEDIHDHVTGMMDGKLGKLAKEIAEETAADMDIDIENADSVNDVFKNLFKNPTKLMGLVKNVGSKLDEKIKSGDIKESELLQEAGDIVQKMKNMPGMENLQGMLGKMGMPGGGGGKMDMNAMQSQIDRNMKGAMQKDRMRAKLAKNKADKEASLKKVDGEEGIENLVFSTGETVEKSARHPEAGKKKKKNRNNKKKKGKNKNN
jgi:hypothetical protein